MNVLKLTLSRQPFEVMVTGEKRKEFRMSSKWIRSRLYDKEGKPRQYDLVRFANGYSAKSPYFVARYLGFEIADKKVNITYSNGLHVEVWPGDFIINISLPIERGGG